MPTRTPKRPRSHREPAELLSIGALSRATGIPAETLRTWERRYGSPAPERRPSGHRIYRADVVARLRRIAQLTEAGHRPGDILGLEAAELDRLLAISLETADPRGAARLALAADPENVSTSVEAALRAITALDRDALLSELRMAWSRLGPLRFMQDLAAPLMVAVGNAWHEGRLAIRHEHFATSCLFDFLRESRQPFDHLARGSRVLAATLPGDRHEGGILMVSTLCAYRGHRVSYLGIDTPVDEIAAAALGGRADIVAIGVSAALSRRKAAALLGELRQALPRRVALWVGGSGAPASSPGAEVFRTLDELDARLTA